MHIYVCRGGIVDILVEGAARQQEKRMTTEIYGSGEGGHAEG